jgi:glycosyltransferase involved in cell wall biosynthesis
MSERSRVLHIGPDPALGGGMAASVRGLLASPLAERYRLDIVPSYRGPQPLPRLGVFLLALLRLIAWSLRGRGRIVHIHVTVRGSAYRKSVFVLLAKALRRRVVLHVHGGPAEIAAFRADCGRFGLALISRAIDAADAVLAVSAASIEALREAGVTAAVEVVPNVPPVLPRFERGEPATEEVTAAYLGGFFTPAKGGDVLIEALAQALPREPRLRVVLAGPGEPLPAAIELLAREPAVEWIGWLEDEAKDALLREAEIFVMSSRSEGQPIALLEAMAYGMAIVSTDVGGVPETVKDGEEGLLVPPEEPGDLAEALCRLTADPGLRGRFGAAARSRVERIDEVEVVGRLDALYASLT